MRQRHGTRVDDLSGWECQMYGEVELDPGCSERHARTGDELVIAAKQMIGEEMKPYCCYQVVGTTRFPATSAVRHCRQKH